jgi:hypothetical protein
MDGVHTNYETQTYLCSNCNFSGRGHIVQQKSPTAFFLQPHPLYLMSEKDFDRWVEVLKKHFPDHAMLKQLGKEWYPNAGFLSRLKRLFRRR